INRIKNVFVRVLDLPLSPDELLDDMSLYSPIIRMDSLSLLHLLVALEAEFQIEINDEDVMNANFTTVASLVEMVRRIIETSATAPDAHRRRSTPGVDSHRND